ncbi:ACT domain-containing protein [Sandaracinobacteroides saxicola]|uniref:ACT domain-containing protein n=2 Tax=Sandaracinobacteroides saxicola TaxID=2759707 RepID=A0A7G5IMM8_9SPHN|nr:ACT domain-containing protein [Sandaracinobacteroides saxicola]
MLAGMNAVRMPGRWRFSTLAAPDPALRAAAIGSFQEAEGETLILPHDIAVAHGLPDGPVMAYITLTVHSALDGVGLTAAVAQALAAAHIPCNMVAAFHHDHIFVPVTQAETALAILHRLQSTHQG